MTQTKNPAEKYYKTEKNEQDRSNRNEKDRSQEVDLPIPEKKNDIITTTETEEIQERDDLKDTKTKDAKWQQDKINEANNQQSTISQSSSCQSVDKAEKLYDNRDDSILNPPKTETYEKKQGENVGGIIQKDNYTHLTEEKKRDRINRK